MGQNTGESLIKLLDDPENLVYEAVRHKILQMGPELLPDLESAAKVAMMPLLHERIEDIIRILQFDQLQADLTAWIENPLPRLIDGAWLMTRYQFPDLDRYQFYQLIKPLRDEIWIEISDNLTAIEKIGIMNRLLFTKGRIQLDENHPDSPGNNFINRVLETGKANEHSSNLLYAVLAQESGLPVFMVDMPDYPILAYVDMPLDLEDSLDPRPFDALFYINPADKGLLHSRSDLTDFLIRQSLNLEPAYYDPLPNPEFIRICLAKLSMNYEFSGSKIRFLQVEELLKLWK